MCWREINQVINLAEEHLASWAYWQFKKNKDSTTTNHAAYQGLWDANGEPQFAKIKGLSRPYQRKTQGQLLSTSFDLE